MNRALIAFVLLAGVVAHATVTEPDETPTQVVIRLMESLKKDLEYEQTQAKDAYDKYACYAKDMTKEKSDAVEAERLEVEKFASQMEALTADKEAKQKELADAQAKNEEDNKSLNADRENYEGNKAEYEGQAADLQHAISALGAAIDGVSTRVDIAAPSFIALANSPVKSNLETSLAMADALGYTHEVKTTAAFLQQMRNPGGMTDAEYKAHSGELLKVLDDLKTDFDKQKADLDSDWETTFNAWKDTESTMELKIQANQQAITATKHRIDEVSIELAQARAKVVELKALLEGDANTLKLTKEEAEAKAEDYDHSMKLRAEELKAITECLELLHGVVKGASEHIFGKKSTSLITPKVAAIALSLENIHFDKLSKKKTVLAGLKKRIQNAEARAIRTTAGVKVMPDDVHVEVDAGSNPDEVTALARIVPQSGSVESLNAKIDQQKVMKDVTTEVAKEMQEYRGLKQVTSSEVYATDAKVTKEADKALSFLAVHKEAHRHGAALHSKAAAKAKIGQMLLKAGNKFNSAALTEMAMHASTDPFEKVQELIQGLISRLVQEASEDINKKNFCDTEIRKNENTISSLADDLDEVAVGIAELQAEKDRLDAEIGDLKDQIPWLDKKLDDARVMREQEKAANAETIGKGKAAIQAIKEVSAKLEGTYKDANWEANKFTDETQKSYKGSYEGAQTGTARILGLLKGIVHDFAEAIDKTQRTEDLHAKIYITYYGITKESLAGKTQHEKSDEEKESGIMVKLFREHEELQSVQNLLDSALKEKAGLIPTCIKSGMTTEERFQKREDEITALKSALCTLDTDNVEADCSN